MGQKQNPCFIKGQTSKTLSNSGFFLNWCYWDDSGRCDPHSGRAPGFHQRTGGTLTTDGKVTGYEPGEDFKATKGTEDQ